MFAKFSPDGKWIAFTGQYDGDEQVYVVPASGGSPKQLTFYPAGGPRAERWGYDNQVYGWTKDGSRILFRSGRGTWTLAQTQLYTVSPNGGSAVPLPMPLAGSGSYSPDGKQIVYSKVFRDFRPEKRYSGGQANYLAIFDFATNSARTITKGPRAERDAMWIGGKIYYNSDKDGTFNLYAYDVGRRLQHTAHEEHDLGRALAQRRPGDGTDRVRDGRGAVDPRHEDRPGGADPRQCHRRRRDHAVVACLGGQSDRDRVAEPEGRARGVRGARRHLHRAGRARLHAQPHAFFRRPRQGAVVVSRWIAHRLHLRHDRRGRDLHRRAGRTIEAGAADDRWTRVSATARAGRPTARASRSATRKDASTSCGCPTRT